MTDGEGAGMTDGEGAGMTDGEGAGMTVGDVGMVRPVRRSCLLLPSCPRHRGARARSRPVAASIPSHPGAGAEKATEAWIPDEGCRE